jgi:hypothetical protein
MSRTRNRNRNRRGGGHGFTGATARTKFGRMTHGFATPTAKQMQAHSMSMRKIKRNLEKSKHEYVKHMKNIEEKYDDLADLMASSSLSSSSAAPAGASIRKSAKKIKSVVMAPVNELNDLVSMMGKSLKVSQGSRRRHGTKFTHRKKKGPKSSNPFNSMFKN